MFLTCHGARCHLLSRPDSMHLFQRCPTGPLKSAMVGIFIPWELANAIIRYFFPWEKLVVNHLPAHPPSSTNPSLRSVLLPPPSALHSALLKAGAHLQLWKRGVSRREIEESTVISLAVGVSQPWAAGESCCHVDSNVILEKSSPTCVRGSTRA